MWIEMTPPDFMRLAGLTIGMACLLLPAAAVAGPVDTSGVTACTLSGWSDDPDPAGLNIRAAPGVTAEIIGRVPLPKEEHDEAAQFDIIGSRNGWFLIKGVKFVDYGSGKGDRAVFAGPGWVFADKVRFLINGADVRDVPAASAKVVARLRSADGTSGPDSAKIDHVHGCSGAFADVTAHMEGQRPARGWVTKICSNQVTTCP
jgi:hypothetical protein